MDVLKSLALVALAVVLMASVVAGMIVWIAAMLDVELIGDEETADE